MDIKFVNPGFQYMLDSIMEFQKDDSSAFWNDLFKDSYEEYENPSLKWILSELVVEAVMSDERLCSVNPYYPREQGGCIYPYFFTLEIEGIPVTDTVCEMYRTMRISEFMQESYAYCQKHEAEIREHILRSENGGV